MINVVLAEDPEPEEARPKAPAKPQAEEADEPEEAEAEAPKPATEDSSDEDEEAPPKPAVTKPAKQPRMTMKTRKRGQDRGGAALQWISFFQP